MLDAVNKTKNQFLVKSQNVDELKKQ